MPLPPTLRSRLASLAKGTVLRTLDGQRWEARAAPEGAALDFRDVHALDGQRAWILAAGPGTSGRIYRTTDGGDHWTLQFANTDPASFLDAFAFWDAAHGIALGDVLQGRFQVLVTEDGGATWKPAPLAPKGFHSAVVAVPGSAATFLSLGLAGTGLSRDGGRTWAPLDRAPFNAVAFADAHHGWAVGPRGTIAAYAGPTQAEPRAPRR